MANYLCVEGVLKTFLTISDRAFFTRYTGHVCFKAINIFAIGLILRLSYCFLLPGFGIMEVSYSFGDTPTFIESFKNFWNIGMYTFDINNVDAYYYRPPVYPVFYGIHYVVFGENAAQCMLAFSQCIIDSCSGVLILKIIKKIGKDTPFQILGALLYVFNPLAIYFVPITATETLATFLCLAIFRIGLEGQYCRQSITLGFLCALAMLTRQYLGLLCFTCIIFIIRRDGMSLKTIRHKLLPFILAFAVLPGAWTIRNLATTGKFIILAGPTSGIAAYQEDYIAFEKFYQMYYVDITDIHRAVYKTGADGLDDQAIFGEQMGAVRDAALLAHQCGPSFFHARTEGLWVKSSGYIGCKSEVISRYNFLTEAARRDRSWGDAFIMPLRNIYKCLFKYEYWSKFHAELSHIIIFFLRGLILSGGFISMLFYLMRPESTFIIFPLGMIFYISVFFHVEMRYLAQVDAYLLIFFTLFLNKAMARPSITPSN